MTIGFGFPNGVRKKGNSGKSAKVLFYIAAPVESLQKNDLHHPHCPNMRKVDEEENSDV